MDLNEDGQPERFNVTDNHPGIANKLAGAHRTGGMVLGRITQAPSSQGQPAWVLGPYTEGSDDQAATAWLNTHPRNQVHQPAPAAPMPATPPAPAPVAAPPPAAAAPAAPPAAVSPPPANPAPAAAAAGQVTVTVTPETAALLAQIQAAQGQPTG